MAMFFSENGGPLNIGSPDNILRSSAYLALMNKEYFLQADGHELEYILSNISNIPRASRSVITWRGEFARFIIENLFA